MSAEPPRTRTTRTDALAGRTCVVTGGSRGPGRAIAAALGRRGATVAVNYRSSAAEAEAVAATVEDAGGEAEPVRADVTERGAVAEMYERVRARFGPVDVLVNAAGITRDARFEDMTAREWHRVLAVGLTGAFNCTKAFYRDLQDADEGRLITVAGGAGRSGAVGRVNEATATAGLVGFTGSLAREIAATGSTANCVVFGSAHPDLPTLDCEDVRERIPTGRFEDADGVAAAVALLADEAASDVSGAVVDGGIDP